MEEEQYPQQHPNFEEAGRLFAGSEHKIMGMDRMTPRQEFVAGMENHQPHRLMGIHPDEPAHQEQMPMIPEQRMPMQQGDPFSMGQYGNVNMPDVPVSFGGGMAEQLLNDNEVPEGVRKKFWPVFHKDNVLTFLDEERKRSKLLNYDIMKIDWLNAMPYYDYSFEKELEFNILRNVFETKLDRALGFKGANVKNERVILQSQFSEQRSISESGDQTMVREGFFKRLLGRR